MTELFDLLCIFCYIVGYGLFDVLGIPALLL